VFVVAHAFASGLVDGRLGFLAWQLPFPIPSPDDMTSSCFLFGIVVVMFVAESRVVLAIADSTQLVESLKLNASGDERVLLIRFSPHCFVLCVVIGLECRVRGIAEKLFGHMTWSTLASLTASCNDLHPLTVTLHLPYYSVHYE
jgi:hypothetical protein